MSIPSIYISIMSFEAYKTNAYENIYKKKDCNGNFTGFMVAFGNSENIQGSLSTISSSQVAT
jgi:hypothetical protein